MLKHPSRLHLGLVKESVRPLSVLQSATSTSSHPMVNKEKLDKLNFYVSKMLRDLHLHNSLVIHRRISEFYYLEKVEELKLLKAQLMDAERKLEDVQVRVKEHYKDIFCTWRKDARWLNQHKQAKSI